MQTQTTRKTFKRVALAVAILACSLLAVSSVSAQAVPDVLPYQGYLARANGTPVDGTVNLTFRLYTSPNDQNALWTETHSNVIVEDGVFYLYLGQEDALDPGVFTGANLYLGIAVNNDNEATPRQSIGSVPYAIMAGNSAALGGFGVENFVTQNQIQDFITEGDLANFVTQDQIQNFVTEGDLANFVTQDQLNNLQTNLQNQITNLQNQVNNLQTTVNNHTNQINNLTTEVSNIGGDVATLETTIEQIETNVTNLQTTVNNIQVNGGGGFGVGQILGVSNNTSTGAISFGGRTGMGGADAMCRATFGNEPTAHLCTLPEIQRALATNQVNNNVNNVETWFPFDTFHGFNATDTTNNSCHHMLYPSGHIGRGTTLTVFLNQAIDRGVTGHNYNIKHSIACGGQKKVLCCK